jgi:hypothetical protein
MNSNKEHTSEQMTPNQILAEGWRLTRATFALKGMEIPHTIEFLIDGRRQIRATRVATLEDLAQTFDALNEDIERLSRVPRRAITVGDELESLRPQDCGTRPYLRWLNEEIERLSRRSPTDIVRFETEISRSSSRPGFALGASEPYESERMRHIDNRH